ncbi:hypothetical protein B0H15DRAFT_563308 [Mycena belliarum]|uniref:Uncharacterized protein n=1 Tax=Mycena belliarum TaxID=1033014 RepID=A0AAD6XNT6_9AGAR|nr:hypothetical protein B0H15DRAFT_563308 [Mycena belliae]
MVHRPADSRLLANLLSQEKEYAKHLATLLDHSNASLASVTAYASASSPASAHLILAVAGSLSTADEALRHYAAAVDRWRDYLKGLKALEDEVGNIMRDREILVTRLIKVSKPTLHASPSSSSLLLSPIQSQSSLAPNTSANAKLAAAQTELQACEAHLAAKEVLLDVHRAALVREGLAGRCRALAECGRRWSAAGSAGAATAEGAARAPSDPDKPLPGVAGSDVSLAPSQSASQIHVSPPDAAAAQHIYSDAALPPPSSRASSSSHYVPAPVPAMALPAAHAMTDLAVPFAQRVLARRITEEDLLRTSGDGGDGGSSAGEEDAGPLAVVENPRFAVDKTGGVSVARAGTLRRENTLKRERPRGGSSLSVPSPKSNTGFFGSLRGFFGRGGGSEVGTESKGSGRRRKLGRNKRKGTDADADDSDDPGVRSESPAPFTLAAARVRPRPVAPRLRAREQCAA